LGQQPVIQASFNSGEWSPALYARVDLAKYHSGAALLRNFFVDYRGGATTRPGSRYILKAKSSGTVRLIPFQASFNVSYMLEFGAGYIRFYNNGSPVLESAHTVTGITNANPGVVSSAGHGYSNGDWVYFSAVGGMTQVNGSYYIVAGATANTFQLHDLNGNAVDTTAYGAFVGSGSVQRVYTIATTYLASELFQIKYAQDVNILVLCHPAHAPASLTLNVNNVQPSWTFASITFGSTVTAPTVASITTNLSAGAQNLAYRITAVDANGQESAPTAQALNSVTDFFAGGSVTIVVNAVAGAVAYNFYRSVESSQGAIPAGVPFGFIGTTTSLTFVDTNALQANFALTPPVVTNPFSGTGVSSVTMTSGGTYTPGAVPISCPTVSFSGGGGSGASGQVFMGASAANVTVQGRGYVAGNIYTLGTAGSVVTVLATSVSGSGQLLTCSIVNAGSFTGTIPGNDVNVNGAGVTQTAQVTVSYQVTSVGVVSPGTAYTSAPAVAFSYGTASATSAIGTASSGNPTVPGFVQQRMFLGGPVGSPAQYNLSQPGSIYNYNITFPTQDDNAIQRTLTSQTLNSIKSATSLSTGMLILSDKGAWLTTGGSLGSGIGATTIVDNPQTYAGSSDLPPIVAPNDLLYVQSKGSIVRDLAYNYYLQNYTGADISVLSSHLFYGFSLTQWAWAEEPFKVVWAVRNDGIMLSLTFVKEQELIAWAHHDTQGTFQSVATVTEATAIGFVDAIYVVANRTINGVQENFIERFVELNYPQGYISSWQVDAGIGYNGSAATTFQGAQHLGGAVVTGLADGAVINFTMPTSGTFVFGPGGTTGLTAIANASVVTVGLALPTPTVTTLPLDLGEPTAQGKRKKITGVTLLVNQTLGLSMGRFATTVQPLSDLVLGNQNVPNNATVTDLVSGYARGILDPLWDVPGQYTITQPNPYPASILGVVPEIAIGDDA
jgi:Ubiquitin-activating enzyme E1 FCCH domain